VQKVQTIEKTAEAPIDSAILNDASTPLVRVKVEDAKADGKRKSNDSNAEILENKLALVRKVRRTYFIED
jgi:hypothetical protein